MENFLTTVVFLLPGFLLYFWIQSFGVNPVVKHSPIELTAISALLWLPVSSSALALYNILIKLLNVNAVQIKTLKNLQEVSGSLTFLISFLLISVVISFLFGALWSKLFFPLHLNLINLIRKWRGVAKFSKTPSVWDEIFLNDNPQVVEYGKIGEDIGLIGEISKASRTFEPDKYLFLRDMDYYSKLIKKYEIPVSGILIDTRTGTYAKLYNSTEVKNAVDKENATSSES